MIEEEEVASTMNTRTQNTITANVYTLITKDNDRVLFSEDFYDNSESMAGKMFDAGSGVKCNVCNIMRTTVEALQTHNESRRHKTLLNHSRNKKQL